MRPLRCAQGNFGRGSNPVHAEMPSTEQHYTFFFLIKYLERTELKCRGDLRKHHFGLIQ